MGRIDDLKEQHPYLNINILDVLKTLDPSGTNKYLMFLLRIFKDSIQLTDNKEGSKKVSDFIANKLKDRIFEKDDVTTLNKFEKYSRDKLFDADISQIHTFKQLKEFVDKGDFIIEQKKLEKEVIKWYEDDQWLLLTPLTSVSAETYGKGTKWCVTNAYTFNEYSVKGVLVYIFEKNVSNNKWALFIHKDGRTELFSVDDKKIDSLFSPLPMMILEMLKTIHEKAKGFSTERFKKSNSHEYVLIGDKYYEIVKLEMKRCMEALEMLQVADNSEDYEKIVNLNNRITELQSEPENKPKSLMKPRNPSFNPFTGIRTRPRS